MKSVQSLLWPLFLLAMCLSTGSPAAVMVDQLTQPVSIAGQWQFRIGDDPSWASAQLQDSDWDSAGMPSLASRNPVEYAGMAWYRQTIQLDLNNTSVRQQLGALGVTLGAVSSAYELYAGGHKLGGVGALPPEPEVVYDWYKTYSIPRSAIDDQGRLVLAMRVWRAEGDNGDNPYQGPFLLGNIGDLRYDALLQAVVPNLVMTALYLAIGLYHLLIARRNPSMREFFWFGWFAIALAFYSFETTQFKYSLDIPFILHKKLEYFSLYMIPFLLTETLVRVIRIRLNLAGRAFQYIFPVAAVVVAAVPNLDIHYLTLPVFQALAALWSVGIVLLMAWHGWQGNRRARAILGIMLLGSFAVFNYVMTDSSLVSTATYLLHFSFAMIILFMAVLMANTYTATLAKLEQSVEQRTADLQRTNRELEKAVAVRSQFLANMSHELRTPMNAIIGLTHLGLKTGLTEQQRGYLTTVDQSAHALGGIIESIFDFSKLEAGELECDQKPFSLDDVIARLAAGYRSQAEEKGLDISFDRDPAIPCSLVGDGLRLGQVLAHLTSNAIKFTEHGQVRFAVRLLEQAENRVTLEFSVADSGIGLSAEQQGHLFESFSQADASNTRSRGGAGLGLAISKALAELMGGSISAQSTPGVGSTFSLRLPLAVANPDAGVAREQSPATGDGEIDLSPVYGARVLLVDDSEINLQVASELLGQARLHIDLAHNGQEAVDRARSSRYDCVLMDIQMPVMDGYTATTQIHALDGCSELPILAMTANVLPEDRAKAKAAGLADHIPKPIEPKILYRKLLQWIEHGERAPVELDPEPVAIDKELPDQLPGIDIADGMKRVGGNASLYLKLLSALRSDYATAPSTIAEFCGGGDSLSASQLAHKLRGIANNLGATSVGACAEKIEHALKAGQPATQAMLAALADGMSIVIDSIASLEQRAAASSETACLSEEETRALLQQLKQEIAENNPGAEATVGKLLQSVSEADPIHACLASARDAIDIFDFAAAAEHLATLPHVSET